MLIRKYDLVEIARDGDLVVFKIAYPGAFALQGIREQRENVAERHSDRINSFLASVNGGRLFVGGTVIDPETGLTHAY